MGALRGSPTSRSLNKQERHGSRVGFDAFAILELDPTDQLLTPDRVRLAMRRAIRHFFIGGRDPAAKGRTSLLWSQVSEACQALSSPSAIEALRQNIGQEMEHHLPDPSILKQRS